MKNDSYFPKGESGGFVILIVDCQNPPFVPPFDMDVLYFLLKIINKRGTSFNVVQVFDHGSVVVR